VFRDLQRAAVRKTCSCQSLAVCIYATLIAMRAGHTSILRLLRTQRRGVENNRAVWEAQQWYCKGSSMGFLKRKDSGCGGREFHIYESGYTGFKTPTYLDQSAVWLCM